MLCAVISFELQKILIEKGGQKPPLYLKLWGVKQHQMPS